MIIFLQFSKLFFISYKNCQITVSEEDEDAGEDSEDEVEDNELVPIETALILSLSLALLFALFEDFFVKSLCDDILGFSGFSSLLTVSVILELIVGEGVEG